MADLSGMFQQLNAAVLGNPLAGDAGGRLLTGISQGMGGALGAAFDADKYGFMTEAAREKEGLKDLAKIDMTTSKGMEEAAKVYQSMGELSKAAEMAQAVRLKRAQDMEKLEQGQEEIMENLKDTKARRVAAASARAAGDDQAAVAIMSGQMEVSDYYKARFQNKLDTEKATATAKPEKGDIVEIELDGKKVKGRSFSDGRFQPIGKVPEDWKLVEQTDTQSGITYNAFVKPGTNQVQRVGVKSLPTTTIKGSAADGWTVFDQFGNRLRKFDNQTDAEKYNANFKQVAEAGNIKNKTFEALRIIGAVDENYNFVQGFNPESGGWESMIYEYLPNTDERTLRNVVNVIKSNLGFEALTALEEPLTPVSNVEIMLLQQRLETLDTWDNPAELAENLWAVQKHMTNIQRLALGEPVVNTIDWESPAYRGIVQTVRADDGTLKVKLPDGTWITQ